MSDKLNGILLINKPANITSFGVIAKLRKSLNIKKIGHSGTLDPNATGLLVIMIGKATKLLPYLDYQDKTYAFSMKLGIKTNTGDIWGEITEQAAIPNIIDSEIIDVFKTFVAVTINNYHRWYLRSRSMERNYMNMLEKILKS